MRAVLAILFLAAAIWRTGADWQATIGVGYAFRPMSFGGMIAHRWPDDYRNLVESLQASGVPFVWDPVGALLLSLPVGLVLAAIALGIWMTRARPGARR
ncbi:hypothetical protein [Amaricoccus sp.]|uniref:hypothetical protein n=1 Tax=Amaricoccus sp. TaxID=1872485 RepID=UPI00262D551E|nr:hypothetical protein [Amaricoccus sp.]HRO12631.1 hypothetical protein [Amaricoccus sp.]